MAVVKNKFEVNPNYVSELLGPLSLAVAMDAHGSIFSLVDYSDSARCSLVISHLVLPVFNRLAEITKQEVKASLGCLVENSGRSLDLIEDVLLLCGVGPDSFNVFLNELWVSIFPLESYAEYVFEEYKLRLKPLSDSQFVFSTPEKESLRDRMSGLHEALLD